MLEWWHSRQETQLEQIGREENEQSLYRALNRTLARESPLYREVVEGTIRNTVWSQALRPVKCWVKVFSFYSLGSSCPQRFKVRNLMST